MKPKRPKALWFQIAHPEGVPAKRRKPVKRQSAKRRREIGIYTALSRNFLRDHPACAICLLEGGPVRRSKETHHTRGRKGSNYLDVRTFLAVCEIHHARIHAEPAWAFERGYLGSFISNVRKPNLNQ